MPLPTRFDPELYQEYRPSYPLDLFATLKKKSGDSAGPKDVLDVGCGTGLSLESFAKVFPEARLFGVDPDPAMLDRARTLIPQGEFHQARAENLPFEDASFDLVLVGSAYHWFEPEKFALEVDRVVKKPGSLFIFEYQFPKALENSELNEWIRRQFNQRWRAPGQTPRGSLRELTRGFEKRGWKEAHVPVPLLRLPLSAKEILGQILSQSRYLHSETPLNEEEKGLQRQILFQEIESRLPPDGQDLFDFRLSAHLWTRSVESCV